MTLLDFILIAILVVCFIFGFWNGLVKQLATILGIVAGIVVAVRLAPHFAEYLHGRLFGDLGAARVAAYVILFLAAALSVWLVGLLVRKLIKKAELGLADRVWGGGFGILKGVVFCWAVLLAIVPMKEGYLKGQVEESWLAPRLLLVLNTARGAFPKELRKELGETVERWKRRVGKEGHRFELPELPEPPEPPARRDYR